MDRNKRVGVREQENTGRTETEDTGKKDFSNYGQGSMNREVG